VQQDELTSLVEPLDGEPFVLHRGVMTCICPKLGGDVMVRVVQWATRVFSLGRRFGASVAAWVRPQSHINHGMVRESQCACALVAGSRDNVGVAPGLCVQDNTDRCGTRSCACVAMCMAERQAGRGISATTFVRTPTPWLLATKIPSLAIRSTSRSTEKYSLRRRCLP
jgi:hypothetical protein